MILDPVAPADAFALAGCPVCQALPRIEAELLDGFCRHGLGDPDARERVLAVGGLCVRHWWLVAAAERVQQGAMPGTAELLADVLDWFGTHGAVARCPLCVDTEAAATTWFHLLLDDLGLARLNQAPPSWRPCLPHLAWLRDERLDPWLALWVDRRRDRVVAEATAAARRYLRTRQRRHHEAATGAEAEELLAAMAALLGDRDRVPAGTRR
jgi:hypothetical protein